MTQAVVVIPCFNEAERLPSERFLSFASGRPLRLLFVNDGSTDGTGEVLRRLSSAAPGVFDVYDMPRNMGKAEAVRQGMSAAFASGARYAGFWDADLATPLEQIPDFVRTLDRKPLIDMVFGSRLALPGRTIRRRARRHLLGRVFATAVQAALRMHIHDTQCGAKLFRNTPEVRALFAEPFCSRWIFDVEIIARLIHGRRGTALPPAKDVIHEYPLDFWEDVAGSKLKAGDFRRAAFELASIWRRYLRPGLRPPVFESIPLDGSPGLRRAA